MMNLCPARCYCANGTRGRSPCLLPPAAASTSCHQHYANSRFSKGPVTGLQHFISVLVVTSISEGEEARLCLNKASTLDLEAGEASPVTHLHALLVRGVWSLVLKGSLCTAYSENLLTWLPGRIAQERQQMAISSHPSSKLALSSLCG